MMGRIFREVKLIEKLGTGLKRMISLYARIGGKAPVFQELNNHFRVTLFPSNAVDTTIEAWEQVLLAGLLTKNSMTPAEISKLWGVSTRTARTRLNKMIDSGKIVRVATAPKDPYAVYKLK